ncbi:TPA: DUF3562 domain-containing protein [Burkholderia vietnamiensis]|nr:DUF3562 domain-containing protein [Burkholderia vietnamiensis]
MAQHNTEELVRAIAADLHAPTETVSKMFSDVWSEFSDGATITDYLPLLVARRVRENLRSNPPNRH